MKDFDRFALSFFFFFFFLPKISLNLLNRRKNLLAKCNLAKDFAKILTENSLFLGSKG